jgi:hypothetical protein
VDRRHAHARQAAVGAHPQAALAVALQRQHAVVRQPFARVEPFQPVTNDPSQAVAVGARPHAAIGVAPQAGDRERGQRRVQRRKAARTTDIGAVLGAYQQPPVGHRLEREHRARRQTADALGPRQCALDPHQPLTGAGPDLAGAVAGERIDRLARQAVCHGDGAAPARAVDAHHAIVQGSHPQGAVTGIEEIGDQAVHGRQCAPVASVPAHDAAAGAARPQVAAGADVQSAHAVVEQARDVAAAIEVEVVAVVPDQPLPRGQPEKPVGSLADAVHGAVRQPVTRGPYLHEPVRQRQCVRTRQADQREREGHQDASQPRAARAQIRAQARPTPVRHPYCAHRCLTPRPNEYFDTKGGCHLAPRRPRARFATARCRRHDRRGSRGGAAPGSGTSRRQATTTCR